MGAGRRSNGSPSPPVSLGRRLPHWIVYRANRLTLTALLALGVFGVSLGLTEAGYLAVGPNSNASSLFSGGFVAGVLTLVTIVLSINQLILSRVFGSIQELDERLDGAKEFRAQVEDLANVAVTPNDPAAFLALLGATASDRAGKLRSRLATAGESVDDAVLETLDEAAEYGDSLDAALEREMSIPAVLDVLFDREYAPQITSVRETRRTHDDDLDDEVRAEFRALEDVFGAIGLTRQFFKTLALQENLARLSRIVAVTGLAAFFATIGLSLLYRSNGVTIDPALMPVVVSAGLAVISVPVLAVIVYTLRAATVARQTVSVGTFVQPEE